MNRGSLSRRLPFQRIHPALFSFVVWLPLLVCPAAGADPVLYQGRLANNGEGVDQVCDLQFTLFDAAVDGTPLGTVSTHELVALNGGLFTVPLDFGEDVFDGGPRWLEIALRCPAGAGAYVPLSPRQPLVPAPSAHTLVPKAVMRGDSDTEPLLDIQQDGQYGALRVESTSALHEVNAAYAIGGLISSPTSISGAGVRGEHAGSGSGVIGYSRSGYGVQGISRGTDDQSHGVYGNHNATTGTGAGVKGDTNSRDANAVGVLGRVRSTVAGPSSAGVYGHNVSRNSNGSGVIGWHDGSGIGVNGHSEQGIGVHASVDNGTALWAIDLGFQGRAAYIAGDVEVKYGDTTFDVDSFSVAADSANFVIAGGMLLDPTRLDVYAPLYVHTVPFGDYRNVQWNDATGLLYYDNSSARYKENIQPLETEFERILEAEPKTYTRPGRPERWEIGFLAEDFDRLGLEPLVEYDTEGLPDGVRYDKVCLYLIEVLRAERDRRAALERTLADQQAQIDQLARRMGGLAQAAP